MIYTIGISFATTLSVVFSHLYFLGKIYVFKLSPFLLNDKINWNPNIDRLKVFTSTLFFGLSFYFTKDLLKLEHNSEIIFYFKLIITPILTIGFFLLNTKFQKLQPFEKRIMDSQEEKEVLESKEIQQINNIQNKQVSIYKNFQTINYFNTNKKEIKKSISKQKIIENAVYIKNLIIDNDSLFIFETPKNLSILAYKLHKIGIFKIHRKNKNQIRLELIKLINLTNVNYDRANFSKYTKSYLNEDEKMTKEDEKIYDSLNFLDKLK